MKRKHIPGGCYCCGGCEELNIENLPEISIEGYSFVGWGGSDCCKCAFFSPDNPQWTEVCSPVFASIEEVFSAEYQEMAVVSPKPKSANLDVNSPSLGVPCPIPPEYCCYSSPFAVANHEVNKTQGLEYKLLMRHQPYVIEVCFSRQDVTCDQDPPVLKWIVRMRKVFNVVILATEGMHASFSHSATGLSDCFELRANSTCGTSCTETIEPACTEEDLGFSTVLFAQEIGFDRVKFFDELPDTLQVFTEDDTPENCTWEYCNTELNYDTQVCFTQSSYHNRFPECICEREYLYEIAEKTVYAGDFANCNCNSCVGLGFGINFQLLGGEDCGSVGVACCGCESQDNAGNYLCPDLTVNSLRAPCGGSFTDNGSCIGFLGDLGLFQSSDLCGGSAFDPPLFDTHCIDYIYYEGKSCYTPKGCAIATCNLDCCHDFICAGNNERISCSSKFARFPTNWISIDVELTCNLIPQSLCIDFGSVPVNFA